MICMCFFNWFLNELAFHGWEMGGIYILFCLGILLGTLSNSGEIDLCDFKFFY